jgi:hypothetical protein
MRMLLSFRQLGYAAASGLRRCGPRLCAGPRHPKLTGVSHDSHLM